MTLKPIARYRGKSKILDTSVTAASISQRPFRAKQKPLFDASTPVHVRIRGFTWRTALTFPSRYTRACGRIKALSRREIHAVCPGDKSCTGVYPGRMTIVRSRARQAANRSEYQNMRLHRNRRITLKRIVAHRNSSCIALDRFSRKPLKYHVARFMTWMDVVQRCLALYVF